MRFEWNVRTGWCPTTLRQPRVSWWVRGWERGRQLLRSLTVRLLRSLDPSTRFPKPKPPPLSVLAQSVGKETLISNKYGRKPKIKRIKKMDGWAALENSFF